MKNLAFSNLTKGDLFKDGGVFKVITTVFVLPGEVKVYTFFGGKSELVKTFEQEYKILVGLSYICFGNN